MATDNTNTWPFPGKRSDVKNLGKTVLQIEREQLAQIPEGWLPTADNINALPNGVRKYIHELTTNCDPSGLVMHNTLLRDNCDNLQHALNRERGGGLLSADECAIAVNDPNGCASWLRQLADAIERGEHVGITGVSVAMHLPGTGWKIDTK